MIDKYVSESHLLSKKQYVNPPSTEQKLLSRKEKLKINGKTATATIIVATAPTIPLSIYREYLIPPSHE